MPAKRTRKPTVDVAEAAAPSHAQPPPAPEPQSRFAVTPALQPRKLAPIYQLKVTLQDIAPPIWRRFQVRGDITLYRLHGVLQTIMGWENAHLYDFTIGKTRFGPHEGEFGRDVKDDARTKLNSVAGVPVKSFTYNYDFGDRWEHEVVVEEILPPDNDLVTPVCLAGERACPPEDCGGTHGYEELLETIARRTGGARSAGRAGRGATPFDPEAFDLEAINTRLRQLR
ncbi:MAG: plasmid pRiA4b ORF-3 family protein [bacterium]